MHLSAEIMSLLKIHWRTLAESHSHQHDALCFKNQRQQIENLIRLGRTITFVLPAFPAKSPNREKTAGVLPDLGERLALRALNDICRKIHAIYRMGAQMIICSDGRVFSDLVQVSDADVDAYAAGIKEIIAEEKLTFLSTFSLEDYYDNIGYDRMRDLLSYQHGDLIADIKSHVKINAEARMLFNGIHRFIFEDRIVQMDTVSKNQVRRFSKDIAYQVIQRSHAWSRLVENHFPDAIRLSIHPQHCHSAKMGMMLLNSQDLWATPWHRVVLIEGEQCRLVRKKEAEALHAAPVFCNDRFSHYTLKRENNHAG